MINPNEARRPEPAPNCQPATNSSRISSSEPDVGDFVAYNCDKYGKPAPESTVEEFVYGPSRCSTCGTHHYGAHRCPGNPFKATQPAPEPEEPAVVEGEDAILVNIACSQDPRWAWMTDKQRETWRRNHPRGSREFCLMRLAYRAALRARVSELEAELREAREGRDDWTKARRWQARAEEAELFLRHLIARIEKACGEEIADGEMGTHDPIRLIERYAARRAEQAERERDALKQDDKTHRSIIDTLTEQYGILERERDRIDEENRKLRERLDRGEASPA